MEAKGYGAVDVLLKTVDTKDDGPGEFEAVLSAPTVDRDGEVIDPKAFEPLPDHITIDVDHGMSVGTTVGSGVPFYDGDLLMFRGTFSSLPRAQEVRTLVQEGHIRKMSVAFRDAERDEKDGIPHITRAELLNAAIVPIPSNREADILAAKAEAFAACPKCAGRPDEDPTKTSSDIPSTLEAPSEEAPPRLVGPLAHAKATEAEALLALLR